MREYELMHIHTETPNTETAQVPKFVNRHHDLSDDRNEVIEYELNLYGPSVSISHHLPTTTTSTTIIIQEKQSLIYRLSRNFTITGILGYFNGERALDSNIRQDPNMKLKQRWILLIFILSCIVLILLLSSVKFRTLKSASQELGITLKLEALTDREKCPACFGVNLCPAIFNEEIELNDWNKFSISRTVNVKNIFFATWKDEKGVERQIVLKKLAHNEELDELDKSICDRQHGHETCDVSDSVIDLIEKYKLEQLTSAHDFSDKGIILNGELIGHGSDLLLCPSHRKMDFVVEGGRKSLRGQHHDTILANMLTMMLLNPEPLLLQAFPKSDGWPFPTYYGACGRIIAEEYVGRRLTTFVDEPFVVRASLAKQLLEMATKFYDNPTNFIIYVTDVSPDNFAVEEDTGRVLAVDLENFIVVDKEILIKSTSPEYDKLLEAESTPCGRDGNAENLCFSYSAEDLCVWPHTDHNYYSICAGLLAEGSLAHAFPDGLLHSLPPEFSTNPKLKTFHDVLLKCKDPKLGNPNWHYTRVEAADELIHQLDIYLKSQQKQNK